MKYFVITNIEHNSYDWKSIETEAIFTEVENNCEWNVNFFLK